MKRTVYLNIADYDSEIREIAHFNGYIIINQSFWYPDKYTEEEAKEKFLNINS